MNIFLQACTDAASVWEQSVFELHWYHLVVAAAYLGAAWLCLANGHFAREVGEGHVAWFVTATALFLLAANSILHFELFVTDLVRTVAKLEGWYGERRMPQYLLIFAAAILLVLALVWLRFQFAACDEPSERVAFGLIALLLLLFVRTVSAHGTDAVLELRLVGVSIGRWLEFAGIGLVAQGALRCLRLR
jgi:hypothetical protein